MSNVTNLRFIGPIVKYYFMKFVFIYGPPGVGKLTVAKELAKITDYKLFHNHLTVELVSSIFPFGSKTHLELMEKIRFMVIEAAAKEGIKGIIFTFVYWTGEDDKFVKEFVRRIGRCGGEVLFVRLYCSRKELYKRIRHPSRKKFSKLKSVKELKEVEKKHDMDGTIGFGRNLSIDNTCISPKACARKIKSYFKL